MAVSILSLGGQVLTFDGVNKEKNRSVLSGVPVIFCKCKQLNVNTVAE
jgi:hypothetical protein